MSILEGVDLSYANLVTNTWAKFYIVKATEDVHEDPRWGQHSSKVKAMKRPLAAYHFLRKPGDFLFNNYHNGKKVPVYASSIDAQIAAFLRVAGDVDGYALDWEAEPPSKADTRHAVALVKASGKKCGFYASDSVFFDAGQDWDWVAHYGTKHWPAGAEIWQYQGAPLDRDRFEGTQAQLLAMWRGHSSAPVPPTGGTVGLDLTWPPGQKITTGQLTIPKGTDAIRVSNGKHYTVGQAVTRPAAVKQIAPTGSTGYDVDLVGAAPSDVSHFIRRSETGLEFKEDS
jgi:hypothetical protein